MGVPTMADIVLFTPKNEVDVTENLRRFIALCRDQLTVFGADLRFDEDVWDITESLGLKAKGKKRERLVFSTVAVVRGTPPVMMSELFRPFAKAYMRYMHGMRPTKSIGPRLAALRALETSLAESGVLPDIVRTDAHILNRAAQIAEGHFTAAVAFRVGGQLEIIGRFLTDHRLSTVPVHWKNFIRRPSDSQKVGKEFDDRREEKMPSRAVLEAIPKAFRLAVEPTDILVTAIVAILLAAPDRINEVLLLPVDCEVNQKQSGGRGDAYGLRWWPAKGAEPMVKLIVSTMAEVVRDAVSRIRRCTDEARTVAAWYESHPDKIYLPDHLEYLRKNEFLSLQELGAVLWVSDAGARALACSANAWRVGNALEKTKKDNHCMAFVRFADVERVVLAMLPTDFPFVNKEIGLKYSDALLIIRQNEMDSRKAAYRCAIGGVTVDMCNNRLGSASKHGKKSVFERLGLVSDDGSILEVTTHQFRHYLNTLA